MEQAGGGEEKLVVGDLEGIEEAASPISSRPPAAANFEDMMRVTAEGGSGGGGGGSSGGNRWPRQETLALLQIRSEMDTAFKDATPKAPLWEQVSRKLAELGYKRSGKKCKEKFENVHKYYKRTKEGRTGRQDGKSYKFFNQLEALHHTAVPAAATATSTASASASASANPLHILPTIPNPTPVNVSLPPPMPQPHPQLQPLPQAPPPPDPATFGISFSSSEQEAEEEDEDDDEEEDKMETESANTRKRKRDGQSSTSVDSDERMMEFFEILMRQVMQKQEALQQRLLEAIEKREQDRMIREEAWKRQNMARIAKEHELIAQERAISATRDAAIISFLQKITGETISLPTSSIPQNPPPPPPAAPPPSSQQYHQPIFQQNQQPQVQSVPVQQQQQQQPEIPSSLTKQSQSTEPTIPLQPTNTSPILPPQDLTGSGGSGSLEVASSRWPKAEVLELIHLRSGLESRYQDPGPKGPLWEEISAGMRRIGYNRSAKRCKEKWENINKYYKKVKESKKQRPEDAKTCPYFHELDALYRKKVLGSSTGAGGEASSTIVGHQTHSAIGGEIQPEATIRKQPQQSHANSIDNFSNHINGGSTSYNLNQGNHDDNNLEEVDENEEYDDETEEDMKMGYNIQFHRQNVGSSAGNNGPASTSFLAMVQ